jgi:predicted dehydrogenase
MSNVARRTFAAAGVTALSYSRILGAADRVRMGFIGLGNRGDQVHSAFLEWGDSQTVAICDLRDDYLDLAARKSRGTPARHKDYRRLLESKEVDAVVIATPDHWHALMFIDACNAGKDVYVEKPLSLTVVEGRKMVEAAERAKRVTQVGTQRRSAKVIQDAVDYVRSGGLGQVSVARGYEISSEWPAGIGNPPSQPPPSEEEWDRWLGPAPKVPFNPNRAYYLFRYFYDYSGGQMTNIGVHLLDTLRWCLNLESPTKVTAMGGQYVIKDNREIPDTLEALWEYEGRTMIGFMQVNGNGSPGNLRGSEMELRGTKGTMFISPEGWEVVPEQINELPRGVNNPIDRSVQRRRSTRKTVIQPKSVKGSVWADAPHARNFLDCVKSRAKCTADVLTGHISTSATLIANIALRTESLLKWDPRAERFTNSSGANKYLHYEYRAPYKLP